MGLTHLDSQGRARMVDVSSKEPTRRRAVAKGRVADILHTRGDLDEALRIRREEEIPVYRRLGAERVERHPGLENELGDRPYGFC